MITCKLNMLLAERRMTRWKLSTLAGVPMPTLRKLYYDEWTGIKRKTLNNICTVLDVGIGELFEFEKNQKEIFNIKK